MNQPRPSPVGALTFSAMPDMWILREHISAILFFMVSHTVPLVAQAQAVATTTLGSVMHLSADWFMIIGFASVLAGFVLWRGKDEGLGDLLFLAVAALIVENFPYLQTALPAAGTQ